MNEVEIKRQEALKQAQEQQAQLLRQRPAEQSQQVQESTAKTLGKDQKKDSEAKTIEYAQKNQVPIAIVSPYQSRGAEERPAQEQGEDKDSPAMKQYKEKMQGIQHKVDERLKAQEQGKGHER